MIETILENIFKWHKNTRFNKELEKYCMTGERKRSMWKPVYNDPISISL